MSKIVQTEQKVIEKMKLNRREGIIEAGEYILNVINSNPLKFTIQFIIREDLTEEEFKQLNEQLKIQYYDFITENNFMPKGLKILLDMSDVQTQDQEVIEKVGENFE